MADINPEQREAMERFYEALQGATRSMGPLEQEERSLAETTRKTKDRLETLRINLQQFGSDLGSTLTSASEGTAKYSQATRSAAKSAGDLFGSFGFLGKAIGGVVKLFGGLVASSLEQNEKLIKSYQNLSDFGAIDSSGVEGLQKDLNQSMKLLVEQAGIYEGALRKLQPELAGLGGSAFEGRKKFTEVMSNIIGGQLETDLRKIGYTQEDIANHAAQYLAREARLGNTQNKNTQQLTEGTGKYLRELQELTMLTGLSREEQQRIRDRQMAEVRFNDHVEQIRRKQGGEAADRILNTSSLIEQFMGKDMAAGYREFTSNFNSIVGESSQKFALATGGAVKGINEQILAGTDAVTGFKSIANAANNTYIGLGDVARMSRETAAMFGLTDEAMAGIRQAMNLSSKMTIEDAIKAMQANKGRMAEEVKRANTERDTKLALDNLINAVGVKVVPLFTKLAEVTRYLAKTFAKIVDKFGWVVGMGDLNLSAAFATNLEDATEILQTEQNKLTDITKERIKTEEKLQKVQKEKLALEEEEKKGFGIKTASKYVELGKKRAEEESLKDKVKSLKERQTAASTNVSDLKDIKQVHENEALAKKAKTSYGTGIGNPGEEAASQAAIDAKKPKSGSKSPLDDNSKVGARKILDYVAKFESGGDYNKMYGGKSNPELANMTIAEVLELQKKNVSALGSSAIGKYQFMKKTIEGFISEGVISPTDKFDAATQEKMGMALLERRGYSKYKTGKMSAEEFANNVAAEWAGMPMANNKSKYAGDGKNKSLVDRQDFMAQIGQAANGGVFSGPSDGYPVMLHGNEMVIPMKDAAAVLASRDVNKSELPTMNAPTTSGNSGISEMVAMLSDKLDSMISRLDDSYRTQEELLQYTRA